MRVSERESERENKRAKARLSEYVCEREPRANPTQSHRTQEIGSDKTIATYQSYHYTRWWFFQCVAVCCSVLQCVAVCCRVLLLNR